MQRAADGPKGPQPRGGTLTEGPIGAHLFRLAAPMLIGIISVMLFNVVDTWFVSRLGHEQLAAISYTFPVVTILGAVALGIGVGTTSVLSRAIGSGSTGDARKVTVDALILGVLMVAVLQTVGLLTIDPLFRLLGATEQTLPMVREYMSVWYFGMVFLVVPMIGNAAIRATGDTRTPAMVMVFAGFINAVLDPLLIFGLGPIPAMGLRGAAIATVLGRATTLVVSLWVLIHREKMVAMPAFDIARLTSSWSRVLRVGLPAAGTNLAVPISVGVVTALVARHGEHAVAAFGAGSRVEMLAMIPSMALGAGLAPFVGQNQGARLYGRVWRAVVRAQGLAFAVGTTSFVVLASLRGPISLAFTDEPEVLSYLGAYLLIAPMAHAVQGVFIVGASTFNAMGKPSRAAALALLRAPFGVVGFAVLGGTLWGVPGIFAGVAGANAMAGLLTGVWLRGLPREDEPG